MQRTVRIVHAQPLAQRIQRIALAGKRSRAITGIDHRAAIGDLPVLRAQQRQFVVEEAQVERRVVDDQLGAIDEGKEFIGDLREVRLVSQKLRSGR